MKLKIQRVKGEIFKLIVRWAASEYIKSESLWNCRCSCTIAVYRNFISELLWWDVKFRRKWLRLAISIWPICSIPNKHHSSILRHHCSIRPQNRLAPSFKRHDTSCLKPLRSSNSTRKHKSCSRTWCWSSALNWIRPYWRGSPILSWVNSRTPKNCQMRWR